MPDADDFDVEDLRKILRGESPGKDGKTPGRQAPLTTTGEKRGEAKTKASGGARKPATRRKKRASR